MGLLRAWGGDDEWENCPSLALRCPWGAGRSEKLPLGNATSLKEPNKTRNNVKNAETQHLHPAAAYSGSGTGMESAWIQVLSCILWVRIMHPGCNRKQKCKESPQHRAGPLLLVQCRTPQTHPHPTRGREEGQRDWGDILNKEVQTAWGKPCAAV